jgi:hypothetical protein
MKIWARLDQGTAAAETAVCDDHRGESVSIEEELVDCTGNDELSCVVCGSKWDDVRLRGEGRMTDIEGISTVVVSGSLPPRSSCCNEELEVQREVHDTVSYDPETYDPETKTLSVSYRKVYPGEADDFTVECSSCHREVECDVEEL